MIRAIIIDDEPAAINALEKKIELYCNDVLVVGKCQSAKEGLVMLNQETFDVLFLDIEMPWMNGFELLNCLGANLDFQVVFVTAYDQYAIKAFKVKAMDYLLKPVDRDDLVECIKSVQREQKKLSKTSLDDLMEEMDKPILSKRVMLHSTEGIEVMRQDEIAYCQASSNYAYIFTVDGRKIIVSKTLSDIERSLDNEVFFRIHKTYTVNLSQVLRYVNKDGGGVVLKSGEMIPVSRRKKEEVLDALNLLQ